MKVNDSCLEKSQNDVHQSPGNGISGLFVTLNFLSTVNICCILKNEVSGKVPRIQYLFGSLQSAGF